MVEKRTLIFLILTTLVWALIATGAMAYYYLEQTKCQAQFNEKQETLTELAENYEASMNKQDLLLRDYNALLGEYYQFFDENCSIFMDEYIQLLSNLGGNYTSTLNKFPKLNETYNSLLNTSQTLSEEDLVTRDEFESLISDFHKLLVALTAKELENFLSKITMMSVNLCIDYGNDTRTWYNVSVLPGMTLFDLTQNLTKVRYDYYPWMEPGHVLVNSINGVAPSEGKYWFWYYWDEAKDEWIFGQVGCDAWILRNNGTYRWIYKVWGS
ncbi:MAG: hypothetical protein ACUVTB_03285 [Candidatus Bathycorpusculaceae bacterium]